VKLFLLLLLFSVPICAQSTAEVIGVTSSGDPIATYREQRYIMLKSEQVAELNRKLDRLDQMEAALPVCQQLNIDYAKRLDTAMKETSGWHSLYDGEHKLRTDMQVFIKRPSRINSFLDKWYVRLPVTFVPPIIIAVR